MSEMFFISQNDDEVSVNFTVKLYEIYFDGNVILGDAFDTGRIFGQKFSLKFNTAEKLIQESNTVINNSTKLTIPLA